MLPFIFCHKYITPVFEKQLDYDKEFLMDVLSREDYQQAIIDYIEYYNNKLIKVKQNEKDNRQ